MSCRLLVVGSSFWPLVNDSALRLMHWASHLQQRDVHATIVTPRWHTTWPTQGVCREVPFYRLLPPPKSGWSQSHFLKNLARWVILHQKEFDAIYVDEPFSLLHQLAQSKVRQTLPLLGRFHAASIASHPLHDPVASLASAAEACRKLDRVIVPDADSDRRARAAGIQPDKIIRIPDVAWIQTRRETMALQVAKRALAKVSSDFTLPPRDRLIVGFGDISKRSGMELLAKAVGPLWDSNQALSVWWIGDGDFKRPFFEWLRDQSWHRDFLMHGAFDSIEELLQLADLVVFPGEGTSTQFYLPVVIGSGVPFLACSSQDAKWMINDPVLQERFLLPAGNVEIWEKRIRSWMEDPLPLQDDAWKAQLAFQNQFPSSQNVESWLELLDEIARPRNHDTTR